MKSVENVLKASRQNPSNFMNYYKKYVAMTYPACKDNYYFKPNVFLLNEKWLLMRFRNTLDDKIANIFQFGMKKYLHLCLMPVPIVKSTVQTNTIQQQFMRV